MAEEENKRNSCISFYNNPKQRKHSNNKQLFDNDNLKDNSSSAGANKSDGVTELNEKNVVCDKSAALLDVVIDTIDDNDDKLTSDERRKRSTASAGGGAGSRMTSPRPQRVHFSDEDSDGFSRSSRHSSGVDLRQEKSSSPFYPSSVGSSSAVQGQGPVMRPKDLKLAGISQNPTGVKSLVGVGGGSCYHHIQNQGPLNASAIPIVKPQHHRFSYMHCDSSHYTCSPLGGGVGVGGAGLHQHNTSREHHPATVLYSDCAQLSQEPTDEGSSQSQRLTKLRNVYTIVHKYFFAILCLNISTVKYKL